VTQTKALGHTVDIRARIRSASQNKDVVMNRLFSAALLSCAAASLSNPAWSFQGFDFFQQIEQSIECVRKPGTDMLVCSNKFFPVDDEEEDTSTDTTPVSNPESTPVGNNEPKWDLYDRKRTDFIFDGIEKDNCPEPNVTYINEFLDVDKDGDGDVLVGFKCFRNYHQGERPDGTWVKDQLTYDPYLGYVADSYLAVLINNDGEFELDQSIFGGEYPVYDSSLTIMFATVADLNSDGYPDVLFQGHWDNSINMIINQYWFPHEPQRFYESQKNNDLGWTMAQSSVMLSDGQGHYKVHELGILDGSGTIFSMTDELGDTYIWHIGGSMTLRKEAQELYSQSAFEFRPTVAKVTKSGDLIDVTDKYLTQQYPGPEDYGCGEWCDKDEFYNRPLTTWMCYVTNKPDLVTMTNNNELKPACDFETNNPNVNWYGYAYQGKFYANGLTRVNTFAPTMEQYNPDAYHCHQFSGDQVQEREACWADFYAEPKQIPSVEIYEMNSGRGMEVTDTSYIEAQFMLIDMPDGTQTLQKFTKIGDNWLMAFGSMGVRAHESLGETLVVHSITGVMLDPGVEPLDILEPYLATSEWLLENHNRYWAARVWYYNEQEYGIDYALNNSGVCLDFLVQVEPEDCVSPENYMSNWWHRGDYSGAGSLSLGYVVTQDGMAISEAFTNLDMPTEAQWDMLDVDNDGDADIYTHSGSYRLPDHALYINTDNQSVTLSDSEFWQDVAWEDREQEYQEFVSKTYREIGDSDAEWFLSSKPKKPMFYDMNGDGILDFVAIKGRQAAKDDVSLGDYLEVIYGE